MLNDGAMLMSIKNLLSNTIAGIAGATIIHSLVQMLLWIVSFGPTFADNLSIWLILLPIPLVLGIVASIFTTIWCRTSCNTWTFIVAVLGMIGAMVSVAFVRADSDVEIWGSFLTPIMGGVISELVITGLSILGAYLLKRMRYLIRN